MAVVKRSVRISTPAGKVQRSVATLHKKGADVGDILLPREPSPAASELGAYSLMLHGEKKIGKTSLLGEREGTLVLELDPPQKALSIMQLHVPDWDHYLQVIHQLTRLAKKDKFPYKHGVIDRCDIWYRYFFEWFKINRLGGQDPGDIDGWGAGQAWAAIKQEFADAVRTFVSLPWSAAFICHSKWKTIKTVEDGLEMEVLSPDLSGVPDAIITGEVDILASYQYFGKARGLIIQGDETTRAGHRCKENFWTPNKKRVRSIPMGKSSEQGRANLLRAFNNEQQYPTVSEMLKNGGAK